MVLVASAVPITGPTRKEADLIVVVQGSVGHQGAHDVRIAWHCAGCRVIDDGGAESEYVIECECQPAIFSPLSAYSVVSSAARCCLDESNRSARLAWQDSLLVNVQMQLYTLLCRT